MGEVFRAPKATTKQGADCLRRRSIQKGEAYILDYEFPPHMKRRVQRRHPELNDDEWKLVERGLREWFICCAWRGRTMLGMPSRVVDDAWHEFILDSVAYTAFCNIAFVRNRYSGTSTKGSRSASRSGLAVFS